jgi:hypothetical protein
LTFPLAVSLYRFFIPLCVFCFGIMLRFEFLERTAAQVGEGRDYIGKARWISSLRGPASAKSARFKKRPHREDAGLA